MPRRIDYKASQAAKRPIVAQRPARGTRPSYQDELDVPTAKALGLLHDRCDYLEQRTVPDYIDFCNVEALGGGTTTVTLQHNFGGPVNAYPVDLLPASATPPLTWGRHYPASTLDPKNTVVLDIIYDGTLTIRVEPIL